MNKMDIYNHLPIFAQNMACYYEGSKIKKNRYGKLFWRLLEEYESHNNWSYEQLCEYRDQKLTRMIQHCYNTVPYYYQLFYDGGINPDSIRKIDDLKKLPILTKELVKQNTKQLISSQYKSADLVKTHTSGTTGSGLQFYMTQEAVCSQWAVWWRYRKILGIQMSEWCGLFGGRSVVPINQRRSPFYRINRPCKQIYFSTYHMNDNTMQSYVDAINQYQLLWLHGYPSAIALLAQFVISHNIHLRQDIKFITTGAENLLANQREVIYKAFGVYPYQHYGMSEGVSNISNDRNYNWLIDEDYACTEFISNDENTRIIGTTLTNYAMPFIRYDVGDLVTLKDICNRRSILSIDGREEDYIILPNGSKLGRLDHIFKDMVNVKEAQIVQKIDKGIRFLVVKSESYTLNDEIYLRKEIRERLGTTDYDIQYFDQIPKTKSGKLRFVIREK